MAAVRRGACDYRASSSSIPESVRPRTW